MAQADSQLLAQLQARIDADPRVQAIVRNGTLMPRDKQVRLGQLQQQLQLPDGYYLNEYGQVTQQRPAWEKYMAPLAAGVAGLTAGAGLGAFTAPATAAAEAAAPAIEAGAGATIPTIASTTYGTGMASAIPSIANAIPGGGGVMDAAGTVLGALKKSGGLDQILKMIPALAASVPAIVGSRETDADKQLKQRQLALLDLQQKRLTDQDPLFQAVQRMSMDMLPIAYKGGR